MSHEHAADPTAAYTECKQMAPGASAAVGHTIENSIPLSIFPIRADKFCICVCGLPGVGKTSISRRLARYLEFFHAVPVEVFNASEYRRRICGVWSNAKWFDPTNAEAAQHLATVNSACLADMVAFINANANGVAILDSASLNATHAKRLHILQSIYETGAKVMFIEVSNETQGFVVPYDSPDYEGVEREAAEQDYCERVAKYRQQYEPLDVPSNGEAQKKESKWSYLKCDHQRQKFVLNRVEGYLQLKVVHFIINLRTTPHKFFFSRHGQSQYNAVGRIGGDSGLSPDGLAYAHKLAEFVQTNIVFDESGRQVPARLWTSSMRRTRETAQFIAQDRLNIQDEDDPTLEHEWIQMRPRAWHHLDELFAGACDGMTYEEIEEQFPEEFARRSVDKLAYRYPRGESYLDVIARLEPIIIEMERHKEPLLLVGHQGIIRIIYAFYMGLTRAEAPYVSIPLNCVIQLTPSAFNCIERRHDLYVPPVALAKDGQDEPKTQAQKEAEDRAYAKMVDAQSH